MILRLLTLSLLLSAGAAAQNTVSGTWILQNKEQVTGPEYVNALPKEMTLQQLNDSLIIESINTGSNGKKVSSRQVIAMDGKPVTITSAATNRKYVRTLKWNTDRKGLVLTTVFYVLGNPSEVDFTRVETWSLSPDGKQLNIDKRSVETRSETWQVKGSYKKK